MFVPKELVEAPMWAIDMYNALPVLASYDDISAQTHIATGTIANKCSAGKGPRGGLILGKKKVFPRIEVVLWLLQLALEDKC